MNLRAKVEELLPNWERWYPSLFDAASDLGIIKARVCDPSSLLLTNRHSDVRQQAEQAHREKWGVQSEDDSAADIRRIRFGRRRRNNNTS
jgi:hypothetical protein